jgi:hypothetical protein
MARPAIGTRWKNIPLPFDGFLLSYSAGAEITVVDSQPKNNTDSLDATINVFWRGEILAMFFG